jgi:hypothetical protein
MKFFLTTLLWLSAATSFANETKICTPEADIQKALKTYTFQHWDAGQKAWVRDTKVNGCDDKNILSKTIRAIAFLNQFPKLSLGKEQASSVVITEGVGNYLQKRISTFLLEDETHSSACKARGIVAFVRSKENSTMHLCPFFADVYSSDLMSTYVLVHEARHTEGFDHAGCTHGPFEKFDRNTNENSRSCDATYEEQGSYGVGTGFLLNVYHGSNNEMLRQEARANIVQDLTTRFNKLPLDLKVGILLHQQDGTVSFFDGKKQASTLALHTRVLTYSQERPTFFSEDGSVKSYTYSKQLTDTSGPYAQSYRDLSSHAEQESLLDVFYGETMSCLLFTKKISCVRLDEKGERIVTDIPFNTIRPLQIQVIETVEDDKQLLLVDQQGYTYSLPKNSIGFTKLTEVDLPRSEKPAPFIGTSYAAGTNYGLSLAGGLYSYNMDRQKWQLVSPLKKQKFKKILAPFYWSQQLQEL